MQKNIRKGLKLLIVSDTAMWRVGKSTMAFEPVVREIEHIEDLFHSIEWLGFKQPINTLSLNARTCKSSKLSYRFIPRSGGQGILKKVYQLCLQPYYVTIIISRILKADVVHSRGPSVPALWCILFSLFDKKRIYWHKYAGNWAGSNMPSSYKIQKVLLNLSKRSHVTINGTWPGLHKHVLTFENPCITDEELKSASYNRETYDKLNILFVGRLTSEKGFDIFIESIKKIKNKQNLGEVNIVGSGLLEDYGRSSMSESSIRFHGLLARNSLNKLYEKSHLIVLPSKNEGFPKVIAEAAAYGCIPIVSNVSSISQYINDSNGILVTAIDSISISKSIDKLLSNSGQVEVLSNNIRKLANKFTYEKYHARIKQEILK